MIHKTGRGKDSLLDTPRCSVCGDLAVYVLKMGTIVLCDKHYQQRFGRWSGSSESVADRPVWGAKTMKKTKPCTGGGHYLLADPSHVMMLYSDGAESAIGLKNEEGHSPHIPTIDFDGPTATKTVREMKATLKEADALINFKNATYSTDNLKQAIMKLPINTEVTLQNGTKPNMPLKMTFDFKGKTYHYLLAPRGSDWDEKMNTSGVTLDAESFSAEHPSGEGKLKVSGQDFGDGSLMVGVGTEDLGVGDPDLVEMMIDKDGKINYFSLPIGLDGWNRTYNIKPSHYGKLKTEKETNTTPGGDFDRLHTESFSAEESQREWSFLWNPKSDGFGNTVRATSIEDAQGQIEKEYPKGSWGYLKADLSTLTDDPIVNKQRWRNWDSQWNAESFAADERDITEYILREQLKIEEAELLAFKIPGVSRREHRRLGAIQGRIELLKMMLNRWDWKDAESFAASKDSIERAATRCPICGKTRVKHTQKEVNICFIKMFEKYNLEWKSAESFSADGITMDDEGMRHSPHKECPDCGAKPTSSWIDPGKCECGRVMNPSQYTNISFSAPNCSHKWKTNEAIIANKGLALYVDIVCENCGDETRGWYSFVRKFSDLDALDPKWAESFSAEESEDESVKIEISNPFSTGFFAAIGVAVGLVTTAVAGALIVAGAVGNE